MLPKQLLVQNFLAYRTPDAVVFDGIHLACLSGPNGAGKSSLLDAMTWALWGRARTRSSDDLIHQGQSDMLVQFDFEQGGCLYRVVRKRQRSKTARPSAGQSMLDLFTWDDDDGRWRAISGPSIPETERLIRELLRLDYETFVHSAFLQQGRADAFTAQPPRDRKRILGDILGLERWQVYEERVKTCISDIEQQLTGIQYDLAKIAEEETQEDAVKRDLELAKRELAEAEQQRMAAERRYAEVSGAEDLMNAARTRLKQSEYRIQQRQDDLVDIDADLQRHRGLLERLQTVLADRVAIEAGYARLDEARRASEALNEKLIAITAIRERLGAVDESLRVAREELERRASVHRDRLANAHEIADGLTELQADLSDVQVEVARLEAEETRREERREHIGELKEESAELQAENKALYAEMQAIKARIGEVQAAAATCPLCGQPLDEAQKAALLEDLQAQGTARGDTHRQNQARTAAIKGEIDAHQAAIREIDEELARLPAQRERVARLLARAEDARTAADSAQLEQSELDVIEAMLAAGDFAHELHAQRAAIQAELDAFGYDRAAHNEARDTLATYAGYESRQRELEAAIEQLPAAADALQTAEARQQRWQDALAAEQQEAAGARAEMEGLAAQVEEARQREDELRQCRAVERSAHEHVAHAQQRLRALEHARERKVVLLGRQSTLNEEKGVYEELRAAFGKNGIPAMVIEAAIPELEDAANRLLSQMTEGRMYVRFDTQREKKTGGVIETLDILISDELGTRNYDLYSGGEAFRVDFAIRVALSQLLARRAGAQLRTLFIDEGFGTQDDVGRQRLVEAINAVQEHFDLLLVITHIDELRDAFPVQINVAKTVDGSRVVVR